jgi:hypothetical protein
MNVSPGAIRKMRFTYRLQSQDESKEIDERTLMEGKTFRNQGVLARSLKTIRERRHSVPWKYKEKGPGGIAVGQT